MGKMLGGLGSKLGFGAGGVPGNMPNLSGIDPAQLSALQKQIKNGNLGEKLPGLPQSGLPFPGLPSGLSGNGGNYLRFLRRNRKAQEKRKRDAKESTRWFDAFTNIY